MGTGEPGTYETIPAHQFVIVNASPVDFYPSDIKIVSITLQNIFGYSAYDVSTVIDPSKADPIKFTSELQKYAGGEIGPKQNATIQYEIYIKDSITKGTYYIPVTVLWTTTRDGTVKRSEDLIIGITVAENPEIIKIETQNITTVPKNIKAGEPFQLKIVLKNIGSTKLNQIRTILDVKMPLSIIGSSTEQYIPVLEAQQASEITYNLLMDKSATSRLYNINFTLEYRDYTNRLQSQQIGFGINIEEQSQVYIQDVTLEPTTMNPKSEGLLMIQLANAGTNEVKNVRVNIFGGNDILTQNSNFIGIIQPGSASSETTSFGVNIDPNIEIGDHGLVININYDDVNGMHHTGSNLYVMKITSPGSIIPNSNTMTSILYVFLFILISYVIFLLVGYKL